MCCHPGFVVQYTEHKQSRFGIILRGSKTGIDHWPQMKVTSCISLWESQPVLWSFEARHWLLLSSYESPRWHLLPTRGCFVYIENLLFSVATFILTLARSSGSYCSYYVSTCCLTSYFYVMETAFSLNLVNQPLLALNFSSVASLLLSAFLELKRVGALLWIRLWLKEMLGLVWSLSISQGLYLYLQWSCFTFLSFVCSPE